jgi:hypothetical protein
VDAAGKNCQMARKLVITTFEVASVREQVIELYGFNDKLTNSDDIMATRINLIRDGCTREDTKCARFSVHSAVQEYIK